MPATASNDIQAAAAWDTEHLILFTNKNYLLYNLPTSTIIDSNTWKGLPSNWKGKLDAVCYWKNESLIFFFRDEYIIFNRESNSYEPLGLIKNWSGWPSNWKRFSTVINIGNGILYFFNDNQHLRLDINTQTFEGPF